MATCFRASVRIYENEHEFKQKKNLNGQSFNFGPSNNKIYKVIDLVKKLKILMNFKQKHLIKRINHLKKQKF